jgi:multiple sugar transport system substrate-binding protein
MQRRKLLVGGATSAVLLAGRAANAAPRSVTMWHIYSNPADMIHLGMDKFNAAQSDYVLEQRIIPYTQINPELIRALATGSAPDLVVINDPDIASYASQGQFLDLTDRVAASKVIEVAKFFPGPRTSDQWRGRRYSVAREVNTLALYYNADMFRANGLDPDKPPTTWSGLKDAAAKLTDPAKHIFGLGFCAHQSEQSVFQFLPFLWQAGGSIDKLDQPEAAEALQFWADFVSKGQTSRDVINQQQAEVVSAFLAGSSAMAVGGPWELPRFKTDAKFDWRVTPLPVNDTKKIAVSSLGGFHFAIPKGAKEVDGAFRVIETMLDPSIFQNGWNIGALLAPRTDIEIQSPNWPPAYAVYREQMATARQRGPHPQWSQLSRPLQIAIQEALTGTQPPGPALRIAATRIAPILAKTPL